MSNSPFNSRIPIFWRSLYILCYHLRFCEFNVHWFCWLKRPWYPLSILTATVFPPFLLVGAIIYEGRNPIETFSLDFLHDDWLWISTPAPICCCLKPLKWLGKALIYVYIRISLGIVFCLLYLLIPLDSGLSSLANQATLAIKLKHTWLTTSSVPSLP